MKELEKGETVMKLKNVKITISNDISLNKISSKSKV